jgi:hypothetical protein
MPTGFFLLVTEAASKLWQLTYRFDSKKTLSIGPYSTTLSECRMGELAFVKFVKPDEFACT